MIRSADGYAFRRPADLQVSVVDTIPTPTREHAGVAPDARRARLAVATIFVTGGILLSTWFVRIPDIQHQLGLEPGVLGLALFGFGGGALITLTAAGWAVARFGSRPVATGAILSFCLVLPLLAIVPGALTLGLVLAALGACAGAQEVSMNAHGVAVERRYGRPIMSAFHAMYSIGAIAGALAAGLIASAGVGPRLHMTSLALLLFAVNLLTTRWLLPASVDAGPHGPAFVWPNRALLALGVICFCALLSEGAMSDWSALYLRRSLGTGAALAATGFAAFSLAMALGRLAGDRLSANLGPGRVVRVGGLLSATALALLLLLGQPLPTLIGLFITGLGIAAMVPLVISAAGRVHGVPTAPAIAVVTVIGYAGFMLGPASIGLVAGFSSLSLALGIVVGLCLLAALLAGWVR